MNGRQTIAEPVKSSDELASAATMDATAAEDVIRRRRPLVLRIRFQLLVGLAFAVLLPSLVRWPVAAAGLVGDSYINAIVGSTLAILFGYFANRRFNNLPGVRSGSSILFTYLTSFGILVAIFFLARLDYSRYFIASSFLLAIAWFSVLNFLTERIAVPTLGIVPGGNGSSMARLDGARWVQLERPSLAGLQVGGLVADLRHDHDPAWDRFLADCTLTGIPVYHTKQLKESLTGKVEIEHLSENNFGSLLPDMLYLKVKQYLDFTFALAAFPLFMIVYAIVAPLTIMSSGWPVFFTQDRMGHEGRIFKVYKFRTMRPSDPTSRDAAMTRDGDDRITPIGKVLRKYRIDELPQIINILKGEMSWIGPRPEALTLSKWYEDEIPFYRYRHVVRPGISGWAQVNQGHVATPDAVMEKLHYDFFYIKNVSPWLDLLIVMKTLRTVLTGFGAK